MPEDAAKWLERLKAGDESAISELVRSHAEPLRRYLAAMVRSRGDGEDLAQEAFIRLLGSLGTFRGDASVKTYLFRIAHNLALNHLASAPRTYEVYPEEFPDRPSLSPSPHQETHQGEQGRLLREALAGLPPQQRAVVMLRTWQDLSFKEIGAVLSLAEGTVKAHYFFALKNLRKRLEVTHDP